MTSWKVGPDMYLNNQVRKPDFKGFTTREQSKLSLIFNP